MVNENAMPLPELAALGPAYATQSPWSQIPMWRTCVVKPAAPWAVTSFTSYGMVDENAMPLPELAALGPAYITRSPWSKIPPW